MSEKVVISKKAAMFKRISVLWPIGVIVLIALVLLATRLKGMDLFIWLFVCFAGGYALSRLKPDDSSEGEGKRDDVRSRVAVKDTPKAWFDLLKLEYEKAADRYDNIYRAIWQNFSYMAVLAGGILTFGSKVLNPVFVYFLALAPLTFWFVATFLPMDHYGDETRKRLSSIEDQINHIYFPKATDPKLRHFKLFKASKYKWRVREAITLFGWTVSAAWVLMAVLSIHNILDGRSVTPSYQAFKVGPQPFHLDVRDPEMAAVRDSLVLLSQRMQSIDSLIRCQLLPVVAPGRPSCKK